MDVIGSGMPLIGAFALANWNLGGCAICAGRREAHISHLAFLFSMWTWCLAWMAMAKGQVEMEIYRLFRSRYFYTPGGLTDLFPTHQEVYFSSIIVM